MCVRSSHLRLCRQYMRVSALTEDIAFRQCVEALSTKICDHKRAHVLSLKVLKSIPASKNTDSRRGFLPPLYHASGPFSHLAHDCLCMQLFCLICTSSSCLCGRGQTYIHIGARGRKHRGEKGGKTEFPTYDVCREASAEAGARWST